jgi:tripartite-type tricarboxylate transporter receptor subunit TctC
MNGMTRRDAVKMLALAASGVGMGTTLAGKAFAAGDWPTRSVRVLMGFSAGGGADSMTRPVMQYVSTALGQTMVVENRTGGNTVIASQAALQLPPDGYIFLVNGLRHVVNPFLMNDLPFDYAKSFIPVSQMCRYPETFAVNVNAPWKTMHDLVEYARANPNKIRYGTANVGGMAHIQMELLKAKQGVQMVNVPYTNAPDIATDVAGGRLDMSVLTASTIGPMLRAGKVRLLGVGNDTRAKLLPDVPTMAELGYAEANLSDWTGLFAPVGTPDDIVRKMQATVAKAARDRAVLDRIEPQGTELVCSTPEAFTAFLEEQRKAVKYAIDTAHITLN